MKKEISKDMLQKAAGVLTKMGINATKFMTRDQLEGLELNAPMYTTNTGAGEELVNDEFIQEVMDLIPNFGTFLPALPGNHGTGLAKSETLDVIGDVGLFNAGTEKTSGAFSHAAGSHTLATGKVTINQKKYTMQIDVTDELSKFNVLRAEEFERRIREKIAKAMVRTMEAAIINGDPTTTATGNVNSDDAAPAGTEYFLHGTGLRKVALDGSYDINVSTLGTDDFGDMENLLGDYFAAPEDCMWLFNRRTYNTARDLDQFADASKSGRESTIHGNALTNVHGSDLFINRDMGLTAADGKIDTATPANNTVGQFLLAWKPAIQFGLGDQLQIMLHNFGSQGYILDAWFYFGYTIIDTEAGVTDSSVAYGRNVAV